MMIRITNTTKRKHKKILKQTKGMKGMRNRCFAVARQAYEQKKEKQSIGRINRKRDSRIMWIERINAFVKTYGIRYSEFIHYSNSKGRSRKAIVDEINLNPQFIINKIHLIKEQLDK